MHSVKTKSLLLLGVVSVLAGIFLSLNAAIIIVSIVLSYITVRETLGSIIFDSKFFRLVVAFVLYGILLQATVLVVWLISHNFPLTYVPLVTLVILIATYLLRLFLLRKKKLKLYEKSENITVQKFSAKDAIAIGFGILFVALVAIPPTKDADRATPDKFIASVAIDFVSTSIDDSNHLAMINDRLRFDRGVLYQSDIVGEVIMPSAINSYPPGWHSANAIIIETLYPSIHIGGESVVAYAITKLFWFFILIYCFARTILTLLAVLIDRKTGNRWLFYIWSIGAIGFFAYYALLEQFKEGFFSFIPEITILLLSALFLIQLAIDKSASKNSSPLMRHRSLLPLTLLAAGGALSWFLVLPCLVIAVALAHLLPFKSREFRLEVSAILKNLLVYAPLFLLAVVSILVQIYIITSGTARSFSAGINDPGAITAHSSWYYVFVLVGNLSLLFALAKLRLLGNVLILIASLIGFALFIYLFQIYTTSTPGYYFYKTLNTVMAVALPLSIVGWYGLLTKLPSAEAKLTGIVASVLLVLCLPLCIGVEPLNTSNVTYIKGARTFTSSENTLIFNALSSRPGNEDIMFYIPGQIAFNRVGSNLLRSTKRTAVCHEHVYDGVLEDNKTKLLTSLNECKDTTDELVIITTPEFSKELSAQVVSDGLTRKVTIQTLK